MFGFWPYLFDGRYQDFWRDDKERMLHAVFPCRPIGGPPRDQITRVDIHNRLGLLRDLRNRVMHHEPIMSGIARPDFGNPPPRVPIPEIHAQIVEMLEWIDPKCVLTLKFVDRYPDVADHEEVRLRTRIRDEFGIV